MLIPITREKFEQLVPLTATATQYKYYWGKVSDVLKRVLISVVGGAMALLLEAILGRDSHIFSVLLGSVVGLYWLWGPVFWATRRNNDFRKYPYCGFWRGEVLDKYITEELIGTEETVNNRGDLVIVENRERRLTLEVGDNTGFSTRIQVPLQRGYQAIVRGQPAEMLILSYQADLGRITKMSDIYIPSQNLWVSDYPCIQRDAFAEISRQLRQRDDSRSRSDSRSREDSYREDGPSPRSRSSRSRSKARRSTRRP